MGSSSLFSLSLVFVLNLSYNGPLFTVSAESPLERLCSMAPSSYITVDMCLSILKTDPRSRSADYYTLGNIAGEITTANLTAVVTDFHRISSNFSGAEQKALGLCLQIYSKARPSIKRAGRDMTLRKYGAAAQAYVDMRSVMDKCIQAVDNNENLRKQVEWEVAALLEVVILTDAIAEYLQRTF